MSYCRLRNSLPFSFDLHSLIMLPANFSQTAICFSEIVPCSEKNIFFSIIRLLIDQTKFTQNHNCFCVPMHSYFAKYIFYKQQQQQKFNNENALHANNFSPFLHYPGISKHKKVNTLCYWHFIQPTSDSENM